MALIPGFHRERFFQEKQMSITGKFLKEAGEFMVMKTNTRSWTVELLEAPDGWRGKIPVLVKFFEMIEQRISEIEQAIEELRNAE